MSDSTVATCASSRGSISCIIPDAFYTRMVFETMSCIVDRGLIRFCKDGIVIVHRNQEQTALASIFFLERELLSYSVKPSSGSGSELYAVACVSFTTISQICKSLGKLESLSLKGIIGPNGWMESLLNAKGDMGDRIEVFGSGGSEYEEYVDMLQKYYPGEKPTTKVPNAWIFRTVNNFKTRKCASISFVLNAEGYVVIKGFKDTAVSIARCPNPESYDEDDEDNETEEETATPNDLAASTSTSGSRIVGMPEYAVNIDFIKMKDYIISLTKISYPRSVTKIYLKEDRPLILVVNFGNIGAGSFTFVNKVN